jgi:Sulfotransferase family
MTERQQDLAPIFIIGVPRSGTTLLVNMLGMHPLLAPLYETRFLRNLMRLCVRACWFNGRSTARRLVSIVAENLVCSWFATEMSKYRERALRYSEMKGSFKQSYEVFPFGENHCIHYTKEDLIRETDAWLSRISSGPISRDEVWRSARDYVDRLFAIHCTRMGKPYWVNKTPGFLNHLSTLSRLYPDGVYLHMIRDGRDVAVSNLSLAWGPNTVRDAARRWKSLLLDGRRTIKRQKLPCVDVRYEQLVDSPDQVLPRTFAGLGISAETDRILSLMPVFRGRCGVWREKFSREDRKVFAQEAGDLLIELGYETDYHWV